MRASIIVGVTCAAGLMLAGPASAATFVVPTNLRDCTDCSILMKSKPSSVRWTYPGTDPAPLSSFTFRAVGVRWRGWGSPRATSGTRTVSVGGEGQAEEDRVRASLTLDRLRARPSDGCGYAGGGTSYTRVTVRVLSGRRAGRAYRIPLPVTGCETF